MSEKEKVVLSWSGGKDSALALYDLHRTGRYEVVSLLTTLAQEYDRVSHHGVRSELVERQAVALGIPLEKLYISVASSHPCRTDGSMVMHEYERLMDQTMLRFKADGISTVAFGDIFLLHLRTYREEKLA
jgi:diphthamide synthase (EF-2-diphthine--ammonia ligase)